MYKSVKGTYVYIRIAKRGKELQLRVVNRLGMSRLLTLLNDRDGSH